MTIEQALEYNRGNKNSVVLVAVNDLEDPNEEIVSFVKRTKKECAAIIRQAETIALSCDSFMDTMKCFTEKQDLKCIQPVGKVSTILSVKKK